MNVAAKNLNVAGSFILICLISGGCLLGGYWAWIKPTIQQLHVNQIQAQQLHQQIKQLAYQQMLLEDRAAQFPEVEKMLTDWRHKLIKSADLSRLLKQIYLIAESHHLRIDIVNPMNFSEANHYRVLPIRVESQGDYANITRFVEQMADLPWILSIGDLLLVKTATAFSMKLELGILTLT